MMRDILEHAAEACGGVAKLALRVGASTQAVSNWRARGAPLEHCAAIEAATSGAVRRWDLRPLDWHRIWPELIGADGAPPVSEDAPISQAGELDAA